MNERFGVVRGLSSEDAYSRYGLLYFSSDVRDTAVWRPDPLDKDACIAAARREDGTRDWLLSYSCRLSERPRGTEALGPDQARKTA